jgi:hypothetical protein
VSNNLTIYVRDIHSNIDYLVTQNGRVMKCQEGDYIDNGEDTLLVHHRTYRVIEDKFYIYVSKV